MPKLTSDRPDPAKSVAPTVIEATVAPVVETAPDVQQTMPKAPDIVVEPAATPATPLERPAQVEPQAAPQKPSVMKPALVGGIVGALLSTGASYLMLTNLPAPATPPPAAAAIDLGPIAQRIGALEPLGQRISALEPLAQRLQAAEQALQRVEARVVAVEARPAPATGAGPAASAGTQPPPPSGTPAPVDLTPVQTALAQLRRDLDQLAQRPAAAATPAAPAAPPVDLSPLQGEITRIAGALTALTGRVNALPQTPGIDRLGALAVAATALKSAVDRGGPFNTELDAVRTLGVTGTDIAALTSRAAQGVPSVQALMRSFQSLSRPVLDAATPAGETTIDRLVQGASRLVTVRPAGETPGESPAALVSRIEAKLARNDLAGALADLQLLPDPAKRVAAQFSGDLAARVEAERLIARIGTDVARALTPRG